VSGLALFLDNPDRRSTLSLYALTRALHELITLTAKQQNIESPNHILVAMYACKYCIIIRISNENAFPHESEFVLFSCVPAFR
jgi:hypothetical protein